MNKIHNVLTIMTFNMNMCKPYNTDNLLHTNGTISLNSS